MAGITFTVLGLGGFWQGFGGRMRLIREYVDTLPPDRIVIVTDADDVVLLPFPFCSSFGVINQFLAFKSPVVFGAEIFCYPHWWITQDLYPEPPVRDSPFKYLNAGNYIGFAWAVSDVIRTAYQGDCMDDQWQFTWTFLNRTSWYPQKQTAAGGNLANTAWPPDRLVLQAPSSSTATALFARVSTSSEPTCPDGSAWVIKPKGLPSTRPACSPDGGNLTAPDFAAAVPYIQLDYFNSLFLLLGGLKQPDLDLGENDPVEHGGKWPSHLQVQSTGGAPCILHQQGDKEHGPLMPQLLQQLGIDAMREARGYLKT